MAVDLKVVEDKLAKGEALTKDELKEVMSIPPDGESNRLSPEEDIPEEDYHDDPPAPKAKEPAKEAVKEPAKEAAPKVEKEDPMVKIELELSKPDGQEDLKDLTDRERGIFWALRKERKLRQEAEGDRDTLRRGDLQRKQNEDKAKKDKEAQEQADKDEEEILKDVDDEAPLTGKDLKKMVKALNRKPTIKDTTGPKRNLFDPEDPLVGALLKSHDETARKEYGEDYDLTVECTAEIVNNNPVYLEQLAKALLRGDNVAKLTYQLIKADPEYAKIQPLAKARLIAAGKIKISDSKPATSGEKTKEALEAQAKLEQNKLKPKTAAHSEGSDAPADEGKLYGGYTADQLIKMSDAAFAKVPKKDRQEFLKDFGA